MGSWVEMAAGKDQKWRELALTSKKKPLGWC